MEEFAVIGLDTQEKKAVGEMIDYIKGELRAAKKQKDFDGNTSSRLIPSTAKESQKEKVMPRKSEKKVIIIGSSDAGAIAASRLIAKGNPCVLIDNTCDQSGRFLKPEVLFAKETLNPTELFSDQKEFVPKHRASNNRKKHKKRKKKRSR